MVGLNITSSQAQYASGFKNAEDFAIAAERGRLMAAVAIANDPLKKIEMEEKFGHNFCITRWPEAYPTQGD